MLHYSAFELWMQGTCVVRGQCTYTAQNAWIQNASLKANILMGRPLYPARYDAVIKACALEQDLLALPAGAQPIRPGKWSRSSPPCPVVGLILAATSIPIGVAQAGSQMVPKS